MNLLVSRKRLLGNTGDFLWSYGGYLIVSALCDLCGVTLDENNARGFVAECIENLHDTLKTNLSINGANYSLSLNDELINEFIDFYLSVGGKQYLYNKGDECTDVTGGWVEDMLQGYSKTTYEIKTEDCIQMHCCNIPNSFAGARTSRKINFQKYCNEGYVNIVVEQENIVCVDQYIAWGGEMVLNNPMLSGFSFDASNWITPKLTSVGIQIRKTKLNILTEGYIGCYTSTTASNEVFNKLHRIWLEKKYDIGDSYVKSLEEYKAKYENELSRIILDSSVVNVKTKWKKEDIEIYIADGNAESLPNGIYIKYCKLYLYNNGDEFTNITGGWILDSWDGYTKLSKEESPYINSYKLEKMQDYIHLYIDTYKGIGVNSGAITAKKLPLHIYTKLIIDMELKRTDTYERYFTFYHSDGNHKNLNRDTGISVINSNVLIMGKTEIDITSLRKEKACLAINAGTVNGEGYDVLNYCDIKIYKVWLE